MDASQRVIELNREMRKLEIENIKLEAEVLIEQVDFIVDRGCENDHLLERISKLFKKIIRYNLEG